MAVISEFIDRSESDNSPGIREIPRSNLPSDPGEKDWKEKGDEKNISDPSKEMTEPSKKGGKDWEDIELPKLPPDAIKNQNHQVREEIALEWIAKFKTDKQKDQVQVYVYRLFPAIRRTPNAYIQSMSLKDWSIQNVDYNFGGGKYRILLNNFSGNELMEFRHDVDWNIHEPIFDLAELEPNAANTKDWVQQKIAGGIFRFGEKGVIERVPKNETGPIVMTGPNPLEIMKSATEMMQQGFSLGRNSVPTTSPAPVAPTQDLTPMLNLIMENNKANTALMLKLFEATNKPEPPKDDKIYSILELQLKNALEEAKATRGQMADLQKVILEKNSSGFGDLEKAFQFVDKLKARFSPEEKDEDDKPEPSTLERILDKATPVLLPMISAMMSRQGVPQGVPGQPAEIPPVELTPLEQLKMSFEQNHPLREYVAGLLNSGISGVEGARQFEAQFGSSVYNTLAQFPPSEIATILIGNDQFRKLTANLTPDAIRLWVKQFVSGDENVG